MVAIIIDFGRQNKIRKDRRSPICGSRYMKTACSELIHGVGFSSQAYHQVLPFNYLLQHKPQLHAAKAAAVAAIVPPPPKEPFHEISIKAQSPACDLSLFCPSEQLKWLSIISINKRKSGVLFIQKYQSSTNKRKEVSSKNR